MYAGPTRVHFFSMEQAGTGILLNLRALLCAIHPNQCNTVFSFIRVSWLGLTRSLCIPVYFSIPSQASPPPPSRSYIQDEWAASLLRPVLHGIRAFLSCFGFSLTSASRRDLLFRLTISPSFGYQAPFAPEHRRSALNTCFPRRRRASLFSVHRVLSCEV